MLATLRWERASPQLLASVSQMLYGIGEKEAAQAAMKKAAERDPNFYLPLAKLGASEGNVRLAEDSLDTAIKHFTAKIERNPRMPMPVCCWSTPIAKSRALPGMGMTKSRTSSLPRSSSRMV